LPRRAKSSRWIQAQLQHCPSSARAARGKLFAQRLAQVAQQEAQRLERLHRWLELRFGAQLLDRPPGPQLAAVHAARQVVQLAAPRAQARDDRRSRKRAELADARQAENAQPLADIVVCRQQADG